MSESTPRVVAIHYSLTNSDGDLIDSTRQDAPLQYLEDAQDIIPELEEAIKSHVKGDKIKISVDPEHGYGRREDALVQEVSFAAFPDVEQLEAGMQFHMYTESGPRVVRIADVRGDVVLIDANHPLAGEILTFEIEIMDVRAATAEEREQGLSSRFVERIGGGR